MSTHINPGITQLQSPVLSVSLPASLIKTEPLTAIKNEPPEYEIAENGMDDTFVSLEDIKDIDIVSHIICEDSIKSETNSKDILESDHLESVETQIIVKAENAPFVKIQNLTPKENLNMTENASNGNISEGAGEDVVEIQGSNEDFDALDNLSQNQNFAESCRTSKTALWKEEKVKIIKAPAIPVEPHEYISLAEDKHICNHCQSVFNKLAYIKFHIKQMHRKKYQCSYCPFKSKWKTSLQRHIIQKHKDIKDIQMFKSSYDNATTLLFLLHKLIHLKSEEIQYFYCYYCSYKSKRKNSLKTHIVRHFRNEEVTLYYYICDFMTLKRDSIIQHFKKHTKYYNKYDKTEYKYRLETHTRKHEKRCLWDKCDYKTYTLSGLKKHQLIHAKPEEIQYFHCYHCSTKFKQKGHLQIHIIRHFKKGEVPFHCYICDFMTPKRDLIFEHLRKHSEHYSQYDESTYKYLLETLQKTPTKKKRELRHLCDKCDYKAYTPFLMKRHKLIHDKPEEIQYFHCYHCSQKCKQKGHLKIHIFRHFEKGEVPFDCYICDFMTPKRDLIIEHLRKHSKHHSQYDETKYKYLPEARTKKPELRHRCDVCGYKAYKLNRHKLIHLKPEEIQYFHCYHCSHKSKRKDKLKCHISRHFKNEEVAFHCYICDFMTLKRDVIAKHLQKHSKVQIKSEIKEES